MHERRPPESSTRDQAKPRASKTRVVGLIVLIVLFTALLVNRRIAIQDMEQTGAIVTQQADPLAEPETPASAKEEEKPIVRRNAQDTVLFAITQLRQTQDPTVIFDLIDWPSVFNRLTPSQRTSFAVHSPAGMRQYYEEQLAGTHAFLVREMGRKIANFPPEKQKEVTEFIKAQRKLKSPVPKNPVFSETLYELGRFRSQDVSATVQVKSLHKGKARIEDVELIRRDGEWLFTCLFLIDDPINICR